MKQPAHKEPAEICLSRNGRVYLDVECRSTYPTLHTEIMPVHHLNEVSHVPYRMWFGDIEFDFFYPGPKFRALQKCFEKPETLDVVLRRGTGTWYLTGFITQIMWNTDDPDGGVVHVNMTLKMDGNIRKTVTAVQPVDHIELHMQVDPATVTAEDTPIRPSEIPDILHGAVIQVSPENIRRSL
jgi:hypothetical protein